MKQFAMFGAVVLGAIGSYVPMLFGDIDDMIGWSILGGMVGGIIGIWVGVKLYRAI